MLLDAMGKACPMPVIMAKKALDAGEKDVTIAVDNTIAVENLTRLAGEYGMAIATTQNGGSYQVRISGQGKAPEAVAPATAAVAACSPAGCGYAVFVGKDFMGAGDETLGYNLLKMCLYTLAQGEDVPASVLFMNSGVKLPAGEEEQVIDSLKTLIERGTEVLVCGTCLNYFGLTEQLKVGTVSNMYDILSRMQKAAKVITL